MKKLLLCFCILAFIAVSAAGKEPKLSTEERQKALKFLRNSQDELLGAVEKLTDEQWAWKPAPERWSVGETAEHIALTEGLLFGRVEAAIGSKPNPEWETKTAGKDELLERVLPDRSRKAEAPEPIRPGAQGKKTRAEVMQLFKESRARTMKFAQETDLPLKALTRDHPFPVFGTLNAYQWLIYIPLHNIRHNQQIAEVMNTPGFPQASAAAPAADATLTAAERAKAIKYLRDSQAEMLAAEKLSDAAWSWKPAPERWSVGEVFEHITLTEPFLYGMLEKALAEKLTPDWQAKTKGKDSEIEARLLNRDQKAKAPEPLQPSAKLSRAELIQRFKDARAKTLRFIEETNLPLKGHIASGVNAYQWVLFIALHNMRHNAQIAEVKNTSGFPR